jgi:hypothetical protein
MSNLQIYKEKATNLSPKLMLASERVGANLSSEKIRFILIDVMNEFKHLPEDVLTESIKKGSLGAYGRTYKFCSQEVCFWIREHLKDLENEPVKRYKKLT